MFSGRKRVKARKRPVFRSHSSFTTSPLPAESSASASHDAICVPRAASQHGRTGKPLAFDRAHSLGANVTMEYKGYSVSVSVTMLGSGTQAGPTFTIRHDGAVVHESAVYGKFENDAVAEDAAYQAARDWIDAKCRIN